MSLKREYLKHLVWLVPLILYAPVIFGGKDLYYGTISLQFIPWRWLGWQAAQAGELPLWNPFSGFGAPLAANYQSAFFYPLNWLLSIPAGIAGLKGLAWGHGVLAMLHLALAGWGMAGLVRSLGLGELAQGVSALAFGLSGYLVARAHFLSINAAVAWLPWVLWWTYEVIRGAETKRRENVVRLAVVLSMLFLAGHAQTAWYTLVLASFWSLYWLISQRNSAHSRNGDLAVTEPRPRLLILGWLASAGLIAMLIAGLQLAPTAELLSVSQRSGGAEEAFVMTYSFWPWRFLGLIAPGLFGSPASGDYWGFANFWEDAVYIGLLPFLLALRAVFKMSASSVNRSLVWFLKGLCTVSFLLALGQNTPVFPFLYRNVPTFDLFQAPARFSIWAVFSLALLAGFGAQNWVTNLSSYSRKQAKRWTAVGLALVFAGGGSLIFLPFIEVSFSKAILISGVIATASAGLGIARKRGVEWRFAVLFLVSVDLLVAGWGLNPAADQELYSGPAPNAEVIRSQMNGGRLYLSPDEAYEMTFTQFFQFKTFEANLTNLRSSLLPNLNILDQIYSANQFDPLIPLRYARWMAVLEQAPGEIQSWMLSQSSVSMREYFQSVEVNPLRFELRNASPRVEWFACARNVLGESAALEVVLATAEAHEFGLVVEGSVEVPCRPEQTGTAEIMEESFNRISVRTAADTAGWVLLRDTNYPGWAAEIDGEVQDIIYGNYLFRAVRVPAGQHEIVFVYQPVSLKVGLGMSLAGLGLLGILIFRIIRDRE